MQSNPKNRTVNLQISLEIPDVESFSEAELQQLISDSYTHAVTCAHLTAALKFAAKGKIGTKEQDKTCAVLYHYHNTWADICQAAKIRVIL